VRFWNRYKPRATAAFGCPVECSSTKASHKQNSEALLRRTPEGVCPHGIGFSEKVRQLAARAYINNTGTHSPAAIRSRSGGITM
jgi:hypothetical protein